MKIKRPTKRSGAVALVSIIFVLCAGLYTWQSLRAWSGYEARLIQEQSDYEQLKDTALRGDSTKKRLAAITALDEKLDRRGELCTMHPVYAWQAVVVPPLKEGVTKCEDKVRQLGSVAVPLKALREYLEASEKVQGILQTLSPTGALTETNWSAEGQEQASGAVKDLKALRLTGDAAKLKDKAIDLTQSLVTSWQALIKANDAKDKAGFLTASAAVSKAYADYMELADTADAQLKQKIQAVMTEAEKL